MKKILIFLTLLIIIVLTFIYTINYTKSDYIIESNKNNITRTTFSLMYETHEGSGIYELSSDNTWPKNRDFVPDLSYCENGGTLIWDNTNKTVTLNSRVADKCYLYFSYLLPDIRLNVKYYGNATNLKTSNTNKSLTCNGNSLNWNSALGGLTINAVNQESIECNVTFTDKTQTKYLANYIKGDYTEQPNAGSDGILIHENTNMPNFDGSLIVKSLPTNPIYYSNSSSVATGSSGSYNYWNFDTTTGEFTSDPSLMTTSRRYYHTYFPIPNNGYYKLCYTVNSGNFNNNLSIALNSSLLENVGCTTSQSISGCIQLGNLTTSDYLNISEYAYSGSSSPQMVFTLEKSSSMTQTDIGYRFEGRYPNNYVWFNNELWRIIGAFSTDYDANNDGTAESTGDLIKIIRANPIGSFAYDISDSSVISWENSKLYHLLNEGYYDYETNKNIINDYCYFNRDGVNGNCNFSRIALDNTSRSMISKVKWYLGGPDDDSYDQYYVNYIYKYERDSNTVYSGASSSVVANVGLMYLSDYGYAVPNSYCERNVSLMNDTFPLYSYGNNTNCSKYNWLYGFGDEFTLTRYNGSGKSVMHLLYYGSVYSNSYSYPYATRPVVYLKPEVYLISGSGTMGDPYIIGM